MNEEPHPQATPHGGRAQRSTALPDANIDDLWALMLQASARHRQSAGAVLRVPHAAQRPAPALQRSAETGWALSGAWQPAAHELFALFKPLLDAASTPPTGAGPAVSAWVVAQLGQSLDGCVATHRGHSQFVTGPENLRHLHRLRALSDAVIVGAGTIAVDNPRLTTRLVPGPSPTRVVLDPGLRLSGAEGVFIDGRAPTLWLCDDRHAAQAVQRASDAEVIGVPGLLSPDGALAPCRAVRALAERGLRVLFVEGGGITVTRFLRGGCLNRLHLAIAPVFIGAGRAALQLPGWAEMGDCPRPPCRIHRMGDDVLWDLDVSGVSG